MKSGTIKVLLIEDDEDDYILTQDLLAEVKGGDYAVDWAPSYEDGLEVARRGEHHVCLVDYRLGERSGVQLIREAREGGLTTPMILLTGQGDHDVDVEAIEAGATDYLIKDETPATRLERTIRYAVELNAERCRVEEELAERRRIEVDLEHARDAALESVRLKSEFLANMSHEIRTPMNGVIGMTGLLLETDLSSRQRKYTDTIQASAEALLIIIDDILDFSKIEAGLLRFEKINFELQSAVEASVELLAGRAQKKGLELASVVHSGVPPTLQGDPGRLRQVLTNLIGNAVKFTERGEVIVSVTMVCETTSDATLRFEIQDTGIGISVEDQRRLFGAFVQADGSTTRKFGGTGLGLAISKQLVRLMGGEIGIQSAPDDGSTFWFTAIFEKPLVAAMIASESSGNLSGARLLIVDANAASRRVLEIQTHALGMTAIGAESGEQAAELLRAGVAQGEPFDLALLNLALPDMNGFKLAEAIKSDPSLASVGLVLLQPFGDARRDTRAGQGLFSGYLPKPVRQSQLHHCLTSILARPANDDPARSQALITRDSLLSSETQEPGMHSSTQRILVAEDNVVNQDVALGQLENLGYRAASVLNGRDLLKALEHDQVDLILMDCQMPEMDGFAATAEIRRREGSTRHTPIIAMTANAFDGDNERCLAAGMDDYLSKPVKLDALQGMLERWIGSAKELSVAGAHEANTSFSTMISAVDLAQLSPFNARPPTVPLGSADGARVAAQISRMTADHSSPVDVVRLTDATSDDPVRLRRIVELYVRHTAERLEELESAIKLDSASDVSAIAHKCLGSSETCGMIAIVPSLKELERLGNKGTLTGATNQLKSAQAAYASMKSFLEKYIETITAVTEESCHV